LDLGYSHAAFADGGGTTFDRARADVARAAKILARPVRFEGKTAKRQD